MAQNRKIAINSLIKSFDQLIFDNKNLELLPIDITRNNSSRTVKNAIFSLCSEPQGIQSPKMVAGSRSALSLLGFSPDINIYDQSFIDYFCGNKISPQSNPAAHCYSGFQFGSFAGQLGDGTVMYLGEIINPHTNERWELQLKGVGPTPYSRQSDGRKVLRSSIREFLASEAMHSLGIPTTRAATLITSDSRVPRDIFYSGRITNERCSVISRIASNFFRFGSFEIFHKGDVEKEEKSGPSEGREDIKKTLYEHILSSYYPEISQTSFDMSTKYRMLYSEIFLRTIKLLTLWEGVGFVHGVLNTDNMSIMGLTIDYGPFAFMEGYDPGRYNFTPNGSDTHSRYIWSEQKNIMKWNLERLGHALVPLISTEDTQQILSSFDKVYEIERKEIMKKKFGLLIEREGDEQLIQEFFVTLGECWGDFTDSFYALTLYVEELQLLSQTNQQNFDPLLQKTIHRLTDRSMTPTAIVSAISRKLNILPQRFIPLERIHSISEIIQNNPTEASRMFPGVPLQTLRDDISREEKNTQLLQKTQSIGSKYASMEAEEKRLRDEELWTTWMRKYHNRMVDEMTSRETSMQTALVESMKQVNPSFILRNWIAFKVIEAAEGGDYSKVNLVLEMLQNPFQSNFSIFSENPEERYLEFIRSSPDWAPSLTCTCSS